MTRRPSLDSSTASWTLTTGCQLIGWNSTCTRPSCFGLVRGAPSVWRMAAYHPSSLERLSSHQANMLESLEWFFRLTSASGSMFPTSARRASTIWVDYGTSGTHWLQSLPRHLCTPLWRPVSITVMLSSLGLQRSSPTSCNECWTRQLMWSAVHRSSTAV